MRKINCTSHLLIQNCRRKLLNGGKANSTEPMANNKFCTKKITKAINSKVHKTYPTIARHNLKVYPPPILPNPFSSTPNPSAPNIKQIPVISSANKKQLIINHKNGKVLILSMIPKTEYPIISRKGPIKNNIWNLGKLINIVKNLCISWKINPTVHHLMIFLRWTELLHKSTPHKTDKMSKTDKDRSSSRPPQQ